MNHFRLTSLFLAITLFFGVVDPFGQITHAAPSETLTASHNALARLTVYWAGRGTGTDYWSSRKMSSTGATLKPGACAVDPKVIGYGSKVNVPGIGTFTAVDTGTDVRNRTAARLSGTTLEEKQALVVDLFFETKEAALAFAKTAPHFVHIEWTNKSDVAPRS